MKKFIILVFSTFILGGAISNTLAGIDDILDEIFEGYEALCEHENFIVISPTDVGVGGEIYCDSSSGRCDDLRSAINIANLCSYNASLYRSRPLYKNVVLPESSEYVIESKNIPPSFRVSQERGVLARIGDLLGLPTIYGHVAIKGNDSVLRIESEERIRHFYIHQYANLAIDKLTVRGGKSSSRGGSIYSEGFLSTTNSLFTRNFASDGRVMSESHGQGGAIYLAPQYPRYIGFSGYFRFANAILIDTEFTDNQSRYDGLAIYADGDCDLGNSTQLYMNRVTMHNHNYIIGGSGSTLHIAPCAKATIRNSYIHDNQSSGGAIVSSGDIAIYTSTIANNAGAVAGGVNIKSNRGNPIGALIHSSTFTGNIGGNSAIKCGFLEIDSLNLQDTTIVGNPVMVPHGAAANLSNCTVTASNNVIGDNTYTDCIINRASRVHETGLNVSSDGTCFETQFALPYRLGPLADNGGSTLTMMPASNSPLVNSGTDCLAVDQRGMGRPRAGVCDLGSVER